MEWFGFLVGKYYNINMDLSNILLFGIQIVCFAIAFIIGNTTGNWGLAAPIAIGGFIGGLVIGNIVGSFEDKQFKEKMAAEKKYNEEHAFEIAKDRFSKPEWFNEKFYRRRSFLPLGRRDGQPPYVYVNSSKYYETMKDIEYLDEYHTDSENEKILIYLLRGDDDYICDYLKDYERQWQITLTDDEKKKLKTIISVKDEPEFKKYKRIIRKNKEKEVEQWQKEQEKKEDIFYDDGETIDDDSIDALIYDDSIDNELDGRHFVKVYHLTSYNNVPSIRKKGIMSRSFVEDSVDYTDIAESGALNNHRKAIICGIALDNYARCFFNPMPPMYHNRIKEGYDDLCIVELHIPIRKVVKHGKAFHNFEIDGAKFIKYYKQSIASSHKPLSEIEAHSINEIKWDSSKSAYDSNRDETIAKRGAELLVYPNIPAKYIYRVYMDRDLSTHWLKDAYELGHPEIIGKEDD